MATAAADVEAIERATAAAVTPREVLEIGDWLVTLDPGTIRRANSAVPLRHGLRCDVAVLDEIEAAYAARDLKPAFRIADAPGLEDIRTELARRGYLSEQPTLVKTGAALDMIAGARGEPAPVERAPGPGWAAVFTSEGFDPADGANRVAALSRSADAVYGGISEGERTIAVGVAAFGHGWASVHGMRTDLARRGEGLAGRVLAGLGAAAQARGIDRVFLQVEEGNAGARSLYRGVGFERAWRYLYWSR
ncbi:MAG: GNAT family N-acetyltransferase [Phenylobacterium sp.]|uniref:GNAT family N-acetyltransferase n=1 Tax=Phenylobacterium sp. TaxID=1871053 RepID=UPI00271AD8D0|nr:GNAT family N-acetyltransferase [Phenylobacterium sp.]MDO9432725.1 GNAT family N-acetyltransferase [Phenylobacterium sp.]